MNEGYIYLWKKIMDTSFYKNPNACHLAIHLLLKSNWTDTNLIFNKKPLKIKRGEHISGRKILSSETGLTEREIRTSIEILKNSGFLTSKTTNKFTLFHICKYEDYQLIPTRISTNKRPASDQQVTTPNKYNNNKEIIYIYENFKQFICAESNLTTEGKGKIKMRIKKFGVEKLINALQNFSKDDWQMKNNSTRGVAWFFQSDDKIDQYLNLKPIKKKEIY